MAEKRLLIAIGVHNPDGMTRLPGVIPSIDAMCAWAQEAGYEPICIDDRSKRVNVDRIRNRLAPFLPDSDERDPALLLDRTRIIVYFCGHGIHAAQDQYWILSAGPNQADERISAVALRDALATYAPRQISIISDACRTAQAVQGLASSVVPFQTGIAQRVQKDNFFSSQIGTASFSMPPTASDPGYCVFSRTLLRALSSPPERAALDELYLSLGEMIVSSQSLATYLETHVPDAAIGIGKLQDPDCDPGFRPRDNDYAKFALAADDRVPLSTHKSEAELPDSAALQQRRVDRSRSEWRKPYSYSVAMLAQQWVDDNSQHGLGQEVPFILSSRDDDDLLLVIGPEGPAGRHGYGQHRGYERGYRRGQDYVYGRDHALGRSNIIIGNDRYSRGFARGGRSEVLVCVSGELAAAIPRFAGLWCNVVIERQANPEEGVGGVEMLAWGDGRYPIGLPPYNDIRLSAAETLKGLSAGTLLAADIPLIASDMRQYKHTDPLYGIVSAYLYNRIGDIDNIRRMCYFYHSHRQDVPFDIAMLAQLELRPHRNLLRRHGGGFSIKLPAIDALPENQREPDTPDFAWLATPACTVRVAGVLPLLRVGWQHLQASPRRVHRRALELAGYLTECPIATVFGTDAGHELIGLHEEL